METMSAISSSPIAGRSPDSPDSHFSSSSRFLFVSLRSLSRSDAARSNSCASMAALLGAPRLLDVVLELAVHRRRRHRLDAHARRGLVDEVDGLVGQEAVGDVPVGQLGRGLQRLVGDRDLVVRLVAVAQALEDLHGLLGRGLVDADLLEAPLERGVALEGTCGTRRAWSRRSVCSSPRPGPA
jgi:hypothetical protein